MNSRTAYPFLRLQPDTVNAVPWEVSANDKPVNQNLTYVEHWDYQTALTFRRKIKVPIVQAATDLGLVLKELRFRVVVRAGTGAGRMARQVVHTASATLDAAHEEADFEFSLKGDLLSSRVLVSTDILLMDRRGSTSPLAPNTSCSRLWRDQLDLDLEGSESRFPIEQIDFTIAFPGQPESAAPWLLHWVPGELSREFHGVVRLYINDSRKDFVDRLHAGDGLLQQAMMGDVMIQLVSGCLKLEDDLSLYVAQEAGTIGHVVGNWIKTVWPGETGQAVLQKLETNPGRAHAALLAAAQMPGDPT